MKLVREKIEEKLYGLKKVCGARFYRFYPHFAKVRK